MTVVFKLGGSLLPLPGLAEKIRQVARRRSGENCLFVVGGGATADAVRGWSRVHQLDDETSHWLAISSLDVNRQLLESLTGWTSVNLPDDANQYWMRHREPLFLDIYRFLRINEPKNPVPLPHNWDVTSDSIAAWTAVHWRATELILLKSVPVPHRLTTCEAARLSLVDSYFPEIARYVASLSWCNLTDTRVEIHPWNGHEAEPVDRPGSSQ